MPEKNKNSVGTPEKKEIDDSEGRSEQRRQQHLNIFQREPKTTVSLENVPDKIKPIIRLLASHHAAIDNKVFHWTSRNNLGSIIAHDHFYGHEVLHRYGIGFDKNVYGARDGEYGDSEVICLCSGIVDVDALHKDGQIRDNLVRLTLDLNYVKSDGLFNQFFKLFDFIGVNFQYTVKITKVFTVCFSKSRANNFIICRLFLMDKQVEVTLNMFNDDVIFYGNLDSINLFCLEVLFNLVAKSDDAEFKKLFYSYLDTLEEREIRKILVIFSQGITLNSEYNFYWKLPLLRGLISQIDFIDDGSINLEGLSDIDYKKTLKDIVARRSLQIPVKPINRILVEVKPDRVYQYGIPINLRPISLLGGVKEEGGCSVRVDYSHQSPQLFVSDSYCETRPGLSNRPSTPFAFFKLPYSKNTSSIELDTDWIIRLIDDEKVNDFEELLRTMRIKHKEFGNAYLGARRGLDVLFRNISDETIKRPYAASFGELINFFVQVGVPINERNTQGITLLQTAAFHGRVVFARALLRSGADHSLLTSGYADIGENLTAADLAQKNKHAFNFKFFIQILRNPKEATSEDWRMAIEEEQAFQEFKPKPGGGGCLVM